MLFAVILIMAALLLYSTAIWSEKFVKKLKLWMVVIFITGFLCDLTGTTMMYISAGKIIFNIHGGAGLAALLIMFLHLIWAILALSKRGKAQELFSRYSVYAWGVWLIAFISGIPKR